MLNAINLNNLSDLQKTYLTQLSYLDISFLGARKCVSVGVMIKDLGPILANPFLPFCGSARVDKQMFDKVTKTALGDYVIPTDEELLQDLIMLGLGGITIIDVISDSRSGFQATAFRDSFGNIGISYRGSDFDFSNGGLMDWVVADFLEYFKNDSLQRRQALAFFERIGDSDGCNYLYGHSLGGNLASYVYLDNHERIAEVFIVNGYPINQSLIDTDEKIEAFNSLKYVCSFVCGDVVSQLKGYDIYRNNVKRVSNNEALKPSILSAHLVQSAMFDEFGRFVEATEEEFEQKMKGAHGGFASFSQILRNALNELDDMRDQATAVTQNMWNKYKNEFSKLIKKANANKS